MWIYHYRRVPSIRNGTAVIFSPVTLLRTLTGDHGTILPGYQELHAVFMTYGGGISRGYIGLVSSLSVAPTISEILGIKRPKDSIASPLPIILRVSTAEIKTVTAAETAYVTIIRTSTATIVLTVTSYVTSYKTVVREETKTLTTIKTKSIEVRPQFDASYTAIAAAIALITGLVIGYAIRGFRR
jgi:hypothetical protein